MVLDVFKCKYKYVFVPNPVGQYEIFLVKQCHVVLGIGLFYHPLINVQIISWYGISYKC